MSEEKIEPYKVGEGGDITSGNGRIGILRTEQERWSVWLGDTMGRKTRVADLNEEEKDKLGLNLGINYADVGNDLRVGGIGIRVAWERGTCYLESQVDGERVVVVLNAYQAEEAKARLGGRF